MGNVALGKCPGYAEVIEDPNGFLVSGSIVQLAPRQENDVLIKQRMFRKRLVECQKLMGNGNCRGKDVDRVEGVDTYKECVGGTTSRYYTECKETPCYWLRNDTREKIKRHPPRKPISGND